MQTVADMRGVGGQVQGKLRQRPLWTAPKDTTHYTECLVECATLYVNPLWHGIGKQEKCSSLEQQRGNFHET